MTDAAGRAASPHPSLLPRVRRMLLWLGAAVFGVLAVMAVIAFFISDAGSRAVRYPAAVPMIKLGAGERQTFVFESFCLDNSRGGPRSGDAHSLMDTRALELRPYLRHIFDEYLSHPVRWKQSDVQQAVWYTEGRKKWDSLSADQRTLIQTATGKTDPIHQHPVSLYHRMREAFGVVVAANITLMILASFALLVASAAPAELLGRSLAWIGLHRLAARLASSRWGRALDAVAGHEVLRGARATIEELFGRLAALAPRGRR